MPGRQAQLGAVDGLPPPEKKQLSVSSRTYSAPCYSVAMRKRRLGRTGIEVSEIGYGAWGIGKQMWVGADDKESLRALNQAVDLGLNFIDTAMVYGDGHSERLIGQFLKHREERLFVASKIPPKNYRWPASGSLEEVFPYEYIVKCAETSLQNLGLDTIDLLQLHVWNPSWAQDSQWQEALSSLKEQGKIAHFGISINDHQPDSALQLVETVQIDTVQVIYNIFEQTPEDKLLPLCREKQVGVIARVPFDEGALTGSIGPKTKFPRKDWRNMYFKENRKEQVHQRILKLSKLLGEEAETLPQLALKFCLHHPAVSTVIPGMRSVKHVKANLAVTKEPPLLPETVEALRQHRWSKNFYPV